MKISIQSSVNLTLLLLLLVPLFSCDEDRVINGKKASVGKWKFMAAIGWFENNNWTQGCGGSLITSRHVLTAAHCFYDNGVQSLQARHLMVKLGTHDHSKSNVDVRVKKIHFNNYVPKTKQNDIAILELTKRVNLVRHPEIALATLASKHEVYKFEDDHDDIFGEAAGWGQTETGEYSKHLREVELQLVDNEECRVIYDEAYDKELISGQQLCARSNDNATESTDTCYGDSGGPLMQYDYMSREIIQTGITSFGKGCGNPEYPGVYARVEHFIDWINMVKRKR